MSTNETNETTTSLLGKRNNIYSPRNYDDINHCKPTPPPKKLRCQDPDIIVAVGSGTNQREYEYYRIILCHGSEYFDAMLSHPLKENEESRIELPDKDPDEWELFYEFINPYTQHSAKITAENAIILVPWFQEYQMMDLLQQCDDIISTQEVFERYVQLQVHSNIFHNRLFWDEMYDLFSEDSIQDHIVTATKMFEYLRMTEQYDLVKSKNRGLFEIKNFLRCGFELMKNNKDLLLKKTLDVYHAHKTYMNQYGCFSEEAHKFYNELVAFKDTEWDNPLFQLLVDARIENLLLIKKEKAKEEDTSSSILESTIVSRIRRETNLSQEQIVQRIRTELNELDQSLRQIQLLEEAENSDSDFREPDDSDSDDSSEIIDEEGDFV